MNKKNKREEISWSSPFSEGKITIMAERCNKKRLGMGQITIYKLLKKEISGKKIVLINSKKTDK